jgi:Phospholipid methyltransferase
MTALLGAVAFFPFAFGFAIIGIARVVGCVRACLRQPGNRRSHPFRAEDCSCRRLLARALPVLFSQRAFGADHFDPSVRSLPFVRRGIFRFTSNGMYVYGFLLLWVPALWWASAAALCVTLFNHLYIWVHYFATERPDIDRIYTSDFSG